MANIEGKAHVYISFDKRNPTITSPQGIEYLWIIENVMLIAPVVVMSLYDDGVITNPAPGDGSLMEVQLGKESNRLKTYRFQLVGSPRPGYSLDANGNSRAVIRYEGVLALPKLFHETANFSFRGSSSETLKRVANELGLKHDVDSSSGDTMTWNSGLMRWGQLIERVASRGWFGATSAASAVSIGLDETLRYYSLGRLAKVPPTHTFYHMTPMPEAGSAAAEKAHPVVYLARDDKIAVTTALSGYTATTKYFNRSGALVKHDKANLVRHNNQLNMSADVSEAVNIGTQRVRPSATPNVHPFYEQALYQNVRTRATYNAHVSVLILDTTSALSLYTPAAIRSTFFGTGAQDDALRAVKGLVTARVVGVAGSNYMEKVVIATQGTDVTTQTSRQI